jgi:hypothetical protein
MARKHELIPGQVFARALEAAGIIEDLDAIERIVIDVRGGEPVRLYVQRLGDDRLPSIAAILAGACCDMHNRSCEPPGDLCCSACTEARHAGWVDERGAQRYGHPIGEGCSNPDLSAVT